MLLFLTNFPLQMKNYLFNSFFNSLLDIIFSSLLFLFINFFIVLNKLFLLISLAVILFFFLTYKQNQRFKYCWSVIFF